jgi:hypothetical protein
LSLVLIVQATAGEELRVYYEPRHKPKAALHLEHFDCRTLHSSTSEWAALLSYFFLLLVLGPTLFLFAMQACLGSLEKAMPADAELQFQTNTRTEGRDGGDVPGTDWSNKGEFSFSFWASLYADDAATPLASRAALLAASSAIYDHHRLFGLLMRVGPNGKQSKSGAMYCTARNEMYGDGDTSDPMLDCGGTVSFTESFVYLKSALPLRPV